LIYGHAPFIFHVSAATKLLKEEDCLAQFFALGNMQTCLVISVFVVYVSATFVDQKQGYLLQITQRRQHKTRQPRYRIFIINTIMMDKILSQQFDQLLTLALDGEVE